MGILTPNYSIYTNTWYYMPHRYVDQFVKHDTNLVERIPSWCLHLSEKYAATHCGPLLNPSTIWTGSWLWTTKQRCRLITPQKIYFRLATRCCRKVQKEAGLLLLCWSYEIMTVRAWCWNKNRFCTKQKRGFGSSWCSRIIQYFKIRFFLQATMLERTSLEASTKSTRVTFPCLKLSKFSIQVRTRQRPSFWSHLACMPEVSTSTPASHPFGSSERRTLMTSRWLVWSSWPLSWSRSSTLDTRSVWSTWHCAIPISFDRWGTRLASMSPPSFHTASTFSVWVCTGMRSWLVS